MTSSNTGDEDQMTSVENDPKFLLPELMPHLFLADINNRQKYPISDAVEISPTLTSTNTLVWFHRDWKVKLLSVAVNVVQFFLLMFIGYAASTDDKWLQLKLTDVYSGALIFFVIPTMCLFLSIKLISVIDPFIKENIVIRQLMSVEAPWYSFHYILGLAVLKEGVMSQRWNGLWLWYRFAIVRELAITGAVIYATITLTLIDQAPVTVVFRFYATLFVLDFDESIYKFLFTQYHPKAKRRQYNATDENERSESFQAELDATTSCFEIAYTVQMFVVIYTIILCYILA